MVNVGSTANVDHVGDVRKVHIVVAPDEHDALCAIGVDFGQLRQQVCLGHVILVDLVSRGTARAIDHLNDDGAIVGLRLLFGVLRRLGHQRIEALGRYGHDDHEDDQEHQQNVDHGRYIDVGRVASPASH